MSLVVFISLTCLAWSVNCAKIKGKIVGGQEVNIRHFPYHVSVRHVDRHVCGGSIIAADTILTAAHCTDGQEPSSMSIRHGSSYADYGHQHQVTRIIQNPAYEWYYQQRDVSLLKISPPINFTSSSQPAKLAEQRLADKSDVIICGWGVLFEDEDTEGLGKRRLRAVTVQVVNQEICEKDYRMQVLEENMCAAAEGKDSCQGDSGGALIDKNNRALVAISSWGDGCAKDGKPGVYTSVPDVLRFIKDNL